jgi:DUF4097 and DUF4098 domain-containing protein YvlB
LNRVTKTIAALLLVLPLANAQQTSVSREGNGWAQEIRGNLAAVKILRVKVDVGAVHVEGGSRQGIDYVVRNRSYNSSEDKARREFDNYKVSAYVRGDTAWIVGEWQNGRSHKFSGEVRVDVPREMELVKLETSGGNVITSGIAGRVDASSGGGSIRIDDVGGSVTAETGGGSIEAGSLGADVTLRTGGGNIRITSAKGKISAESGGGSVSVVSAMQDAVVETGGGNIQVERCTGRVKASTGGGSIDLGEIGGPAEIETGGGSIRLTSAKGAVHAETGGGSIELNGVPSARAETSAGGITAKFLSSAERIDSVLETSAGDIVVYLAPNLNLTIRASIDMASGHSIRSDFSEIRVASEGGEWGSKTAEGSLNGGGPVLKVRTSVGNISFLRAASR